MSKGEKFVASHLRALKIRYFREKEFPWLTNGDGNNLRFDFYLPKYNAAIEFDGIFHYTNKRQKYNDRWKNRRCKQNKIHLLRIPHWKIYQIPSIINRFIKGLS